jgi:hypothetical protein
MITAVEVNFHYGMTSGVAVGRLDPALTEIEAENDDLLWDGEIETECRFTETEDAA